MKVCIVGAGIVGLSTAYYLSQFGYDIELIEQHERVAIQASYANAGLLTAGMAAPWNSPGVLKQAIRSMGRRDGSVLIRLSQLPALVGWGLRFIYHSSPKKYLRNTKACMRLAQYNLQLLDQFCIQHKLNIGLCNGVLAIFRNDKEFKGVLSQFNALSDLGMMMKPLSSQEIVRLETSLKPIEKALVGGVYFPQDKYGNSFEFCQQLQAILVQRGVKFNFNQEITRIHAAKGKIKSIGNENNAFKSDLFIMAAGSYTPRVLQSLRGSVPVKPAKGYSLSIPLTGSASRLNTALLDNDFHAAITPLGAQVRVGGTVEFNGYDRSIDKRHIVNLIRFYRSVFPEVSRLPTYSELQPWCGHRAVSVDGVPIIGVHPHYSNLYLNTGHGHTGWSMGLASGKMLSALISQEATEIDPSMYDLARFN